MKVTIEGSPVEGVDGVYNLDDAEILNLGVTVETLVVRCRVVNMHRTLIVEGRLADTHGELMAMIDAKNAERDKL